MKIIRLIKKRSIILVNNKNRIFKKEKKKTFLFIYILMRLTRPDLGYAVLIIYIRFLFYSLTCVLLFIIIIIMKRKKNEFIKKKKEKASQRERNNN